MTFLRNLKKDMEWGRDSWRVLLTVSTLSLIASVIMTLGSRPL